MVERPWTWLRRIAALYFWLAAACVVAGYVVGWIMSTRPRGDGFMSVVMFLSMNFAGLGSSFLPLAVGAALERLDFAAWSAGRAADSIHTLELAVADELQGDEEPIKKKLETLRLAGVILVKSVQAKKIKP